MKFLTTNRFFRILKRFILLLPFTFVLVSSLYVVFNPNAKDSYYGETINDVIYEQASTFVSNQKYRCYSYGVSEGGNSVIGTYFIEDFYLISSTSSDITSAFNGIVYSFDMQFYNTNIRYRLYDINGERLSLFFSNDATIVFDFTFVSCDTLSLQYAFDYSNNFYQYSYNQYSYLNNAFEYGMYEFTNIGFGKIDLVSWFSSLFASDINNVYIQFANSYFNYFIFVECVSILPMFFHWIIHLFEDAIDFLRIGNKKRNGNNDD